MRSRKLKVVLASVIAASVFVPSCSRAQTKSDAAGGSLKPDVQIDLSAHGLPKGFFQGDADTKCGNQIIGYRFVVWLGNDTVAVGFNTSANCRPAPDRKVSGLARIVVFSSTGVSRRNVIFRILPTATVRSSQQGEAGPKMRERHFAPDGLRYATFEAGELRIYSLPKVK